MDPWCSPGSEGLDDRYCSRIQRHYSLPSAERECWWRKRMGQKGVMKKPALYRLETLVQLFDKEGVFKYADIAMLW